MPVVPLEKQRNATFVFASPGSSRLSTNAGWIESPAVTSSLTDKWVLGEDGVSIVMTLSEEIPAERAADIATSRLAEEVTTKDAPTRLRE